MTDIKFFEGIFSGSPAGAVVHHNGHRVIGQLLGHSSTSIPTSESDLMVEKNPL